VSLADWTGYVYACICLGMDAGGDYVSTATGGGTMSSSWRQWLAR
jgi:hypothetical protein